MNSQTPEHPRTRTLLHYLPLLAPLLLVSVSAQPQERLRLIHADELENITDTDGKSVQYLKGNVRFKKGKATISSQRATYRDREGIGIFVEAVKMEKDQQILTCDSLVFDSKNDRVTGLGEIRFVDEEYNLNSDTLTFFLEADSGIASGNVRFTQRKQTVTARRLTYRKKENQEAASYTAEGDVVIREENREATCGRSLYNADDETSILFEDPVIIQEGQILSGNQIYLWYANGMLNRVVIPDRSHITYRTKGKVETKLVPGDSVSSPYLVEEFVDDMTGRRLEAYLVDGRLDSVRLEGMATTLYHLFEDSVYQGKNIASGDTITLLFNPDTSGRQDLNTIHITGGCRGEYHPDESSGELDAPIFYRGDTIHYNIPAQQTILQKSAQIDYKDTRLKSGLILVSWEDNLLHAVPAREGDDGVLTEFPTIIEKGRDPMVGRSLVYDLSTGHGRVFRGKTEMQDGYYRGEQIRNQTDKVFFVSHGIYTTCNLEPEPHFHFESRRMKMITEDKIIARPIVLYIGGIPLFALPFGVIPDQSGRRHSGWILPSYGENANQGQFLEGIGYFWPVNDHWNSQFTLDFYDRQGIVFRSNNQYFKRYAFSGGLHLRYNRTVATNDIADIWSHPGALRWSISWNHSQKLRHNQSLNVNATYYNNSQFNRKLGIYRDTRLDQKAVSNATYSKTWTEYNTSVSVNLSETRNLMAKAKTNPNSMYYQPPTRAGMRLIETTNVLPSLTIRRGQTQLFSESRARGRGPSFYFSYGSTFHNRGTGFYESDSADVDSLGQPIYEWNRKAHVSTDNSWVHNMALSGSDKIFKYIAIRPSLSLREEWITRYFDADSADAGGEPPGNVREIQQFRARHILSLSMNANTKLYGLFPVRIGSLLAIRHTITPTVGFSFQPDYSKPLFGYDFGYFKTLRDSEGNEHLFDPFSGTAIGSTPQRERRILNMSVKNVFQAKVKQGETEKKIDRILTWNMGTSYNFNAEEFRLAKLSSSIRAQLPRKLNLDFSMAHDFYDVEKSGTSFRRVDRIKKNQWGVPTPRLVRVSAATGFTLAGRQQRPQEEAVAAEDTASVDTVEADYDLSATRSVRLESAKENPVRGGELWNLNVSFRYSLDRSNPANPRDNFWMNTNLRLQLTKFWRIQYSARFDLLQWDLVSHDVYVYRDLHCWELSFTWTPGGFGRGFYLRINVKAPTLRDLKVESRGGRWQGPRI